MKTEQKGRPVAGPAIGRAGASSLSRKDRELSALKSARRRVLAEQKGP